MVAAENDALPGGKVFITRGLMQRFDTEAQLAGVLGHEIGHVTARHVDERISQTMLAQLGLAVLSEASQSDASSAVMERSGRASPKCPISFSLVCSSFLMSRP